MFTPSKAFHGCFGSGLHRSYSIGKFVGDASDLNDNWIEVRNRKGVKQQKAKEISNFDSKKLPRGAHLIDLAVAPKANDRSTTHSRAQRKKAVISNQGKKGKSVHKKHAEVLDALSKPKFETLLHGIKQAEINLTKESDTITKNLESLQSSIQRSAQLLLVKKGLVRQLKEFELKRLPKNWNEFWLKFDNTLPCDFKVNKKNVMNKILEQQTNLIDGERKFVGQLDIKVFHATHQKKDWDKFHAKTVLIGTTYLK
jgi:hypothetical protein